MNILLILQTLVLFTSLILFTIGLFFVALGMVGLIRLPDVYNRMHATTKVTTIGTFSIMLAIFLNTGFSPIGLKALTVGIFLILTSPVVGHMVGRAAHRHGVPLCEESIVDEYYGTYKKREK